MLEQNVVDRLRSTVERTTDERRRVRQLVEEGKWRQAEPDALRLKRFTDRTLKAGPPGRESVQGDTADFQAVCFLPDGATIRRAVAFVEVNDIRSSEVGSGFLISPRLFLTCCHVVKDVAAARSTQITFDREFDRSRRPRPETSFLLDPDTFAVFSIESELDYALIALGQQISGSTAVTEIGWCPIANTPDRHVVGMSVNIIQHPRGLPKMVTLRNNVLTYRTQSTLLYETDTDEGSSGSPVFNDDWDVVALHHWGQPFLRRRDDGGREFPVTVNEGVRISAIYDDLTARLPSLPQPQRDLLRDALALSNRGPQVGGERTLSPPRPSPTRRQESVRTLTPSPFMPPQGEAVSQSNQNEIRLVIPIEISVRVGSSVPVTSVVPPEATLSAPVKELLRGSEALRLDTDYSTRSGYNPRFIPGVNLPLPELSAALRRQVAPLRPSESDAEEGELKYEHFSVKLHRTRKVAIFTATNIDGETYLSVDRRTGRVSDSESETWYRDPRVSGSFFLDQSFYSAWSTYFDRGHLTRRTDPTWGSAAEAERANADTFHFTNCSPQHFRFNQSTEYWQGVERYVLENGLLSANTNKPICVFQGPIFDDQIDLHADDVQIPSSFFKVVVWKGSNRLKSIGLVVDQLNLLSERRVNLGPPRDVPFVAVNQWRVAIAQIERRTGLDFGDEVRNADTISVEGQPPVGGEAARLIRSFADIAL
jgi:endonuclease G